MIAWMLLVHIVGIVMWIGGLMIGLQVCIQHAIANSGDAGAELAATAKKIFRTMADPGALLALISGAVLVASNPAYYFHARWLQLKLVCVLILILLHGLVREKAGAVFAGRANATRREWLLLHVFVSLLFISTLIFVLPLAVYWH